MLKKDKERIVAELADRLRSAQSLIVTDYRGLSVKEIDDLRTKLLEHGVRYTVVKNTLTRRAAEQAEAKELLELLDGPTAIAFLDTEADPAAAAKVLNEIAGTPARPASETMSGSSSTFRDDTVQLIQTAGVVEPARRFAASTSALRL